MQHSSLVQSLNSAQAQAVTSQADRLLVLAGAGSGKTRVLVHRIAWLIQEQHLSPHAILAVTFTNKAAAEMRHRIESLLHAPSGSMWVGTFHGIAHRLLRMHWQDAGLPQNFQILDSEDQLRLVKRVMRQLELDDARWPPRQAQAFINSHKDEGLRPEHIDDHGDVYQKTLIAVYGQYQEACERGGMLDFAELLLRSHELWLKQPQLLAHYRQRFRHILVDEFQDTNRIQYAWLQMLSGNEVPITIVGDDDQSIYGWRGARIENIRSFGDDFGRTEVVRLEQNYRSTATILNAANGVIAHNRDRLGKELWTSGEEGEPISVYAGFNEVDEARFIAERIQQGLQQGLRRSEMAILYRSNAQSRVLEEAMLRAGIPYRIYGGHRFFERLEIKNALAYLRLICHRDDDAAFERVVNTPPRGLGDKSLERIRSTARELKQPLWQASLTVLQHKELATKAGKSLHEFLGLIELLDQEVRGLGLSEQAERVIEASGLIPYHQNEKGDRGEARVENIKELISAAREFELNGEGDSASLAAFLDHAALEAGDNQAQADEDCVQMMTLHSAKGLEFPVVFMSGVEEGLFPSMKSTEDLSRMEEERRLAYVGITRAMKKLFITHAESRRIYGSEALHAPSRFIREIPQHCLQEVRAAAKITRPIAAPRGRAIQDADTPYRLGRSVRHPKFGDGVIMGCEGQGPNARVRVNFSGVGEKWLVAQYARLELL
ncbi:MAG: DNA helicase II [Pseudomonadales bacterium]|uniref:DNA helicase II n=1 Tax=unclassified Ketobacter TaxID=2639109 RepID=UPI000C8EBE40|nr:MULTISPECIES: DNA helicase II [unclassified Ketobacter]MAQ26874.1 DNA helicase II [Pseudomonadales bacterium]HAG93663.1 DNA helicase II [Gammaproteobacteria bacterium]RLT90938.1 MAG: DNA helicase II [Ketobacter sp. GenoA1]RLT94587.1 MAG: DNA helicase II [Ketobacter sp.]HAU15407.1 DNA helicase II [Gammaproteobacteria bacterium]|tara:strand:- start:16561 stop:18717 length:2157 start_codon:yes stop_codon:yes gene_type:complete